MYVWGAEVQVPLLPVIEIPPRWNLLSLPQGHLFPWMVGPQSFLVTHFLVYM